MVVDVVVQRRVRRPVLRRLAIRLDLIGLTRNQEGGKGKVVLRRGKLTQREITMATMSQQVRLIGMTFQTRSENFDRLAKTTEVTEPSRVPDDCLNRVWRGGHSSDRNREFAFARTAHCVRKHRQGTWLAIE